MQPKAGSCERILELLAYLCSGDPKGDEITVALKAKALEVAKRMPWRSRS